MSDTNKQPGEGMVACEVCLKEVPRSEARSDEVSDYVHYFCGPDCYQQWRKENGTPEKRE